MAEPKRMLRVHVTEKDQDKVNIRIPLGLAKIAGIGGIANKLASEQGINVAQILRGIDETPDGKIVDVVDEQKGDHVEIFVETQVPTEA